jgi:hypothetical protein
MKLMTQLKPRVLAGAALTTVALGVYFSSWSGAVDATTPPPAPAANEDWLRGTEAEKFALVSKHLRGFDTTMVETGHRYIELYWAGQDRNWEFAKYQLEKIQHTIELGIERRPGRAASAQGFLQVAVPQLAEAIGKKDAALFQERMTMLTANCNACHVLEKMPFVQVKPPQTRVSPVHYESP